MAAEIERKFLLEAPPASLRDHPGVPIEQGYLAIAETEEVRLRREGDRRRLTVKRGHGEVREEVEVDLTEEQFDALWPLTESRRLRKRRYRVPLAEGLEAEVDVYAGELEGLVTAEVEFGSEQQSRGFRSPTWLGKEITGDERYANQRLAVDGVPPA